MRRLYGADHTGVWRTVLPSIAEYAVVAAVAGGCAGMVRLRSVCARVSRDGAHRVGKSACFAHLPIVAIGIKQNDCCLLSFCCSLVFSGLAGRREERKVERRESAPVGFGGFPAGYNTSSVVSFSFFYDTHPSFFFRLVSEKREQVLYRPFWTKTEKKQTNEFSTPHHSCLLHVCSSSITLKFRILILPSRWGSCCRSYLNDRMCTRRSKTPRPFCPSA